MTDEVTRGERLQKVLSRAGIASRRAAEELIREGRVSIDGRIAVLGDRSAGPGDPPVEILVDGEPIREPEAFRHLLLNKPVGYVTTRADPQGRPTVMELVPAAWRSRLKPVGRLDYRSEGLLLLTDDGDLTFRLTHPRFGSAKRYLVKVRGVPSDAAVKRLRAGMTVDGCRTAPMKVRRAPTRKGRRPARTTSWWQLELREGRNRQIREMFFRVGHPVQRLRRVAIGFLSDPHLRPGAWRELSDDEVRRFREATNRPGARRRPGRPARPARRAAPQAGRRSRPAKPAGTGRRTGKRQRRRTAQGKRPEGSGPRTEGRGRRSRPGSPSKPGRRR